jgi:type VI secretion system protein ImpK
MSETARSASMTELATEIILFGLGMRDRARSAQFCCTYQGALKLFDEFEGRAKAERFEPEDIAAARYALAAFVDEVVLRADWPGRDQWAEDPLQLHYFGTYLAGEGFFERLETLRSQAKARSEALAVYHQCLLLGFKGRYGIAGEDRLDALKRALRSELAGEASADMIQLCPHWRAAGTPPSQVDKLPRWFVYSCAAVAAVCVLLYAFFLFSLRAEKSDIPQGRTAVHSAQTEKSGGAA